MYKCVLWGVGTVFRENVNTIKFHEAQGNLKVVAITSNENFYDKVLGYCWISKDDLYTIEYDIIIVMTQRNSYLSIVEEAVKLGITEDKIIPFDIFQRTELDLAKYLHLKQFPPTIFAYNCWGGFTYHSLGLKFMSPTINMYFYPDDYMKFLKKPEKYMQTPLELIETGYECNLGIEYPIVRCDDITLYFNHYPSFEQALESWEKRKRRIDWDNLFVMMYTEEYNRAMDFLTLPYEKKIRFVPFETDEPQLCYINSNEPLWVSVNKAASRNIMVYDDIALLYDGKIKKLCEYRKE